MNWRVGANVDRQLNGVCRACFCNCYGVSSSTVDRVLRNYKLGDVKRASELTDRTVANPAIFADLKKVADYYGLNDAARTRSIPNSVASITCYAWLAR